MTSEKPEYIRFAPHTSRLLAAFVDYLLLSILIPFVAYKFGDDLSRFLCTIALAALYYGVGNSEVMSGQTLGKRVFGLRVLDNNTLKAPELSKSITRFALSFGLIMTLAELPSIVYRKFAVLSSAHLIEAHLGFALFYTLLCLFFFIAQKTRRSFHDVLTKTSVIRASKNTSSEALKKLIDKVSNDKKRRLASTLVAFVLALILYQGGFSNDPEINNIKAAKYYIEAKLPIRIALADKKDDVLLIYLSVLEEDISNKDSKNIEITEKFKELLSEQGLLVSKKTKFYLVWAKDKTQKEPDIIE